MHQPPASSSDACAPASELHLLRLIVSSTPNLLAYWGADLRCRFANHAYASWFGLDPASMPGMTLQELLGEELFELNRPYVTAVLRGEEQLFERMVFNRWGAARPGLARYIPDLANGEVRGFVAEVTDTTLLKRAETELRASETRFRTLAETSPFGIFVADADGHPAFTNANWRRIFGLQASAFDARDWRIRVHPEDREAVLGAKLRCLQQGTPFDVEFRVLWPAGPLKIVHARGEPIFDEAGALDGYVAAVVDETERRHAEDRLRSSESLLERTGRLAGIGGWQLDLRTQELTWSQQTHRIHEVPPGYVPDLGSAIAFYPPEAQRTLQAAISAAIEHGTPWDLELPFVSARGRELWVRAVGEVEYSEGQAVRLVGAFKDVTARHQQAQALDQEHQARVQIERHAQALDRLLAERNEMLDVMAHEVRQPLNNAMAALQSAADVLGASREPEASERLMRGQRVLGSVLASIDNTLAVASLLARAEPIHRVDVDVDVLLQLAIADQPAQARDRVRIEHAPGTWTASMDLSLMRLAVRNLLSNALKYSPAGSPVTVRLSDSDEPLALVLDVVDVGQGVPDDVASTLFQRRPHGDRRTAPAERGLGLGLYIVRRVMELHGGRVSLWANSAEGATFRLMLIQPADEPDRTAPAAG